MSIKLIAIDMDGTLLNKNNDLSDRNKDAIRRAKNKGIEIVIATGRVLKSAEYYAKELELSSYIAACNGAIVVDDNSKKIIDKPLSLEKVNEVTNLGLKEDLYFHFYNEDTFFTKTYVKEVVDYYNSSTGKFRGQSVSINLYDDLSEVINNRQLNVYKIIFIDESTDKLTDFRNKLSDIKGLALSSSWDNNIEVMESGVSKGLAIKELSEKLGISRREIMAIGDNENDLSMIEFAGLGVAMGNASDLLKGKADFISDTNDNDGVAVAIERFAL